MKNYFSSALLFTFLSLHGSWAEDTLKSLSVREKIGQLFMVATGGQLTMLEEPYATMVIESPYTLAHKHIEELIAQYHIGGIIFLYKATPHEQITLTNKFQTLSKLPLLIGQDCENGLSMMLYETVRFPKNLTLAANNNLELIYAIGHEIGKQCKAMGVHINFAPVADINSNPDNPIIGQRAFGDNKERVAACSLAFMRGLQDAGILACAKHFPGHGDTSQDSHVALPKVLRTKEELFDEDLYPFKKLIEHDVACIMNAHLQINALEKQRNLPTSLSPKVATDLLQKQLGFKGLVITDAMGMKAITKHYKPSQAALKALKAGNDIILCPVDVPSTVEAIEKALADGSFTHKELDQRVLKILTAKEKLMLHSNRMVEEQEARARLVTEHALALKKDAYQKAITHLGTKSLVPINESAAVVQVGGYLPSIFEQTLRRHISVPMYHLSSEPHDEAITFIEQKLSQKETVYCALFGMNNKNSENYGLNEKLLQFIENLQQANKKIVLVLFGTPYALELFNKDQESIIAYEDDADAQEAAAHVLLGIQAAQGTLPIEYPACQN